MRRRNCRSLGRRLCRRGWFVPCGFGRGDVLGVLSILRWWSCGGGFGLLWWWRRRFGLFVVLGVRLVRAGRILWSRCG